VCNKLAKQGNVCLEEAHVTFMWKRVRPELPDAKSDVSFMSHCSELNSLTQSLV